MVQIYTMMIVRYRTVRVAEVQWYGTLCSKVLSDHLKINLK